MARSFDTTNMVEFFDTLNKVRNLDNDRIRVVVFGDGTGYVLRNEKESTTSCSMDQAFQTFREGIRVLYAMYPVLNGLDGGFKWEYEQAY